ncbi:MAG: hypothetical protein HXS46_13115 [Theionarchaea archaeon]|nr:MAG: hypothetical protein AYK18_01535 [Theionarchaea archaeon DG-70]MBU7011623.1 hypothetical protein [Theionarchaea archaeon]
MSRKAECKTENSLNLGPLPCAEPMLTVRDVINGFTPSNRVDESFYKRGDPWDSTEENCRELKQQMVQFLYESPGRSYSAIFKHFRREGFTHKDILETYNILLYDKKILRRLNVGTDRSPRYAHFVTKPFFGDPQKDALYDVLGPV